MAVSLSGQLPDRQKTAGLCRPSSNRQGPLATPRRSLGCGAWLPIVERLGCAVARSLVDSRLHTQGLWGVLEEVGYPLAIVRVKKRLLPELPLITERLENSPLAGPFDARSRARVAYAIHT